MRTVQLKDRLLRWMFLLLLIGLVGYSAWSAIVNFKNQPIALKIGRATFSTEVVRTDASRAKGLSGRSSLARHQAMLFVFDSDDTWGIWMKEMKFPIDIVWLDERKTVVHIEHNVHPDAEPYTVYKPQKPARYVLEIPAGMAKENQIREGVRAEFDAESGL